jgi:hypothetical protein
MDWDDHSHYAALLLKVERINHISRAALNPDTWFITDERKPRGKALLKRTSA